MKTLLRKIPDPLLRIVVVLAVLAAVVLTLRSLLPPSLKDHDLQVQATVEREIARPLRHAGSDACAECHDQFNVKKAGYHRNLSCETCHGPAKEHAEDPTEKKPNLPRLREFCVRCHAYNPSRPTGFPQINPAAHNPLKPCITCHDPHDPKPPSVPRECDACHAEIARTKAISPHVMLECTTCHNVPNDHRVKPRAVNASIPSDRNFCGRCHAKGSAVKETPKVDLATHGEKYLCWQCHYPHMPEVK
jgi:ribosomal protein S27AE